MLELTMYSSEIKKIMLDEMLPSFGGNKKQSKIFFSSIHATLSFSLTKNVRMSSDLWPPNSPCSPATN